MNCPRCGSELDTPRLAKADHLFLPTYCQICKLIFMFDKATNDIACVERVIDPPCTGKIEIPPLEIGVKVYIMNKEHPMFLEQGVITEKEHLHYRVKLSSCDKSIHTTEVWFPNHWVRELPPELS